MKLRVPIPIEDEDVDLTPLIDVIFLLVLFFMLTSTFIEEANVYEMQLPQGDADQVRKFNRDDVDQLSVTVQGEYYWREGSNEEKLPDLQKLLEKLQKREDKNRPIILSCDGRCEFRHVMFAKSALKRAGVETIFEEVGVRRDKP